MLIIEKINKSYGKKNVLNDISFSVEAGECIGLIGVNGSGKSTLLNILAGSMKPDSGSLYFDERGKKISFLPQENPLIEELTGKDNIKLWYSGKTKNLNSDFCKTILDNLGVSLFLDKKVKAMSGGMKKRLGLAICMLENPDVLLLDEPLAALDILCRNGILEYLKGYLNQGGSIILTTHEDAALSICDRIFTLKNGTLSEAPIYKYADLNKTEISAGTYYSGLLNN